MQNMLHTPTVGDAKQKDVRWLIDDFSIDYRVK